MVKAMRCLAVDAEERLERIGRILDCILPIPEDVTPEEEQHFRAIRTRKVKEEGWADVDMSELVEIEAFYSRMQSGHA